MYKFCKAFKFLFNYKRNIPSFNMEPKQMNADQWINYFSKLDKSSSFSKNWNTNNQFNNLQNGKISYPNFNINNSNSNRISHNSPNMFFGSDSSYNFNNMNNLTNNFDNYSNIFSFNNSRFNNFDYLSNKEFNLNRFYSKNWMNEMDYDQFLQPKRRKKKDNSNRPIVYIVNIDDYRNGYRNDTESDFDDYDSEYDEYDSEYDDYDSEYEDHDSEYGDDYDERQQRSYQRKKRQN